MFSATCVLRETSEMQAKRVNVFDEATSIWSSGKPS